MKKILLNLLSFIFLISTIFLIASTEKTKANLIACEASVSPTSTVINTSQTFTFSVHNSDITDDNWIRITTPSSNYTLTSGSASGWSTAIDGNTLVFSGNTFTGDATLSFSVNTTINSTASDSQNWGVEASDNNGTNTLDCTGSLGTSIAAIAPTPTPVTTVTVTQTNTTTVPSVAITFNSSQIYSKAPKITGTATDNSSNISSADYSTNNGITWNPVNYLSSTTSKSATFNFTPKLSHTGAYAIKVRARNAQGNYGFTNSISLIIDADPPVIKINTNLSKPLPPNPKIDINATDKNGITSLQFSLDNGSSWQDFDATLPLKSDGNYQVLFRATDTPGNIGALTTNLIIDRLPPRIAMPIFSSQSQILFSNQFLSQSEIKLSFSTIGGVTDATVSAKSISQTITFPVKNSSAILNFPVSDIWDLTISAIDGAGNSVTTTLPQITTLSPGQIISDNKATLSIYQYDPTTNNFRLWSADSYNYLNPLTTNNSFWLYLPTGKYYLKAESWGYHTQITPIFTLTQSTPINPIFNLVPWPFKLPLFWFPSLTNYHSQLPTPTSLDTPINQKYFPRGQNHLVILTTPSSPYFNATLDFLSKPYPSDLQLDLVLPHLPLSQTQLLTRDLPKNIRVLPDPDGDIALLFPVSSNPQFILLDRQNHLRFQFSTLPSSTDLLNLISRLP